ncbi:Protein of unknown function (DUF3298) [Thermanaerovibrio velox DSM 12556]|uniref:DUF3298 domain-containing protein n=1 Tax=Thermanaerovibrio velox DSM 12556 TaxID=926567 RepID=H0UMT3_9BACT|nr:DUF3298 and DUF4163 domain-containing protein [Thermanaerovibrio velox]EHM09228.1 Protein of unknown function (DUF3298) [Thermanaerovibrio velox DSM 12556]
MTKVNRGYRAAKGTALLYLMAALLLNLLHAPAEGAPRASSVTIRREINGVKLTVEYPRVEGGAKGAAKLSINRALRQEALKAMEDMMQLVRSYGVTSNPDPKSFYGERRSSVTFLKGNFISVVNRGFISLPQLAHPFTSLSSATYDLNTGEKVTLQRLFKEGWQKRIGEAVNRIAKERMAKDELLLNEGQDLPSPEDYASSFYLKSNPMSLVVYWERYRFTPGVYGDVEFHIPLKDLEDLIRENALKPR